MNGHICSRLVASGAVLFLASAAWALPVDVEFQIDGLRSQITLEASTFTSGAIRSATETSDVQGTIQTTVDFGDTIFSPTADLTIHGAAILPGDYHFVITDTAVVDLEDLIGDMTTVSPPVVMDGLPTGLVRYDFEMSHFPLTFNQGMASFQISELSLVGQPLGGVAGADVRGVMTILDFNSTGSPASITAELFLPIQFEDELIFDTGQLVSFVADGDLFATATFVIPEPGAVLLVLAGFLMTCSYARWSRRKRQRRRMTSWPG